MIGPGELFSVILVLVANYYVATFCIWMGHWFSHVQKGPLTFLHVGGHHALYPNSRNMRTPSFRYASWRNDSTFTFLPWLILAGLIESVLLPRRFLWMCAGETILLTGLITYVHQEFHVVHSRLARFRWFRVARRVHQLHHDLDANFMVADHFWDKLLCTYHDPARYNPRIAENQSDTGPR